MTTGTPGSRANEAAGLPPWRRFEMVRVELDPEAPAGLMLSEV